jgi:CRISPR/Cas system CSM-associated protein Csm3 (group 7 of RAMP superfamily)
MKSYRITGNLKVRGIGGRDGGPFHTGGALDKSSAYIDRIVFRDSTGHPKLPGTSLCGVMAALARASLRAAGCAEPKKHPAFISLFGSAREDGGGQASRLIVLDSKLDNSTSHILVRDRNGINRQRGSADEKRLFHEEVVDGVWSFPLDIEFTESGPRTRQEFDNLKLKSSNPDALAYRLLLDVLCLLEAGWVNIGSNSAIGYGRFRLEDCRITVRDRCSPDQVLAYAMMRWKAREDNNIAVFPSQNLQDAVKSTAAIAIDERNSNRPSERVRLRCILRPLEPLLVKTGYTTEIRPNIGSQKQEQESLNLSWPPVLREFSVDSGFCLDAHGVSYVPGSSVRGTLRSYVERIVRTTISARLGEEIGNRAAWDLEQATNKGKEFSKRVEYKEDDVECLISRVFGFSALGGRILFSDAVPIDPDTFESRRKLLDHVALDRFTGGAADKRKFNSRPYFPAGAPSEVDRKGDLECEIELFDFEEWHLGMLMLLLRDLRLGRVMLGYGKNKGFGKVRLEHVEMEALSATGGLLEEAMPKDTFSIGGFKMFTQSLSFNPAGYLCSETDNRLTEIFRKAEESMRQQIAQWQPLCSSKEGVKS